MIAQVEGPGLSVGGDFPLRRRAGDGAGGGVERQKADEQVAFDIGLLKGADERGIEAGKLRAVAAIEDAARICRRAEQDQRKDASQRPAHHTVRSLRSSVRKRVRFHVHVVAHPSP